MITKIKILESDNVGEIIRVKNILHDLKIEYKVKYSNSFQNNNISEIFLSRVRTSGIRMGKAMTCIYVDKKDADVFWLHHI